MIVMLMLMITEIGVNDTHTPARDKPYVTVDKHTHNITHTRARTHTYTHTHTLAHALARARTHTRTHTPGAAVECAFVLVIFWTDLSESLTGANRSRLLAEKAKLTLVQTITNELWS